MNGVQEFSDEMHSRRNIKIMAILKIARMGHAVLRRTADPVADPTSSAVKALVADMMAAPDPAGFARLLSN